MFDWLFEGRTSVYILLAAAVVGLFYCGLQLRRKELRWAAVVVAVLIGVYFLLDRLVETGREQVQRKLLEMADAVKAGDTDRVLEHVSSRFSTWGMDRSAFRSYVEPHLRGRRVEELTIWDIAFPRGDRSTADDTIRVTFGVRPKGAQLGTTPSFLGEASFVRDPDGQWRMAGFQVYNPIVNSSVPLERP